MTTRACFSCFSWAQRPILAATAVAVLALPASAHADEAALAEAVAVPRPGHDLRLAGHRSNFGTGGELGYRYRSAGGAELGVDLRGGAGQWWIAGKDADDARLVQGELAGMVPVLARGPLAFQLHLRGGARYVDGGDTLPVGTATMVGAEIAPVVEIAAAAGVTLRSGFRLPVWFAVDPAVELDVLGSPLLAGAAVRVTDRVWLTADIESGTYFGYDGDGSKFLMAGTVGMRLALDRARPAEPRRAPRGPAPGSGGIGVFVGSEWRALGLADHASHGPGFQVGVTLLRGHLKVGLTGFGRPGPVNPKTFEVTAAGGRSYKGSSTLSLRSDGNYTALLVAPIFDVPGADWLRVELPLSVGQAAFGFYLTGEDRDTPDGRRVSEWEDELMDGRDSSFALGAEAGIQLSARLPRAPGFEPYLAARWTFTMGYDAYVTDDYGGPSAALGMQLRL